MRTLAGRGDAGKIADPASGAAVGWLTNAAAAFIRLYDSTASVDPIVRDSAWRRVGSEGSDGTTERSPGSDLARTQLAAAAAEICETDLALVILSDHNFRDP